MILFALLVPVVMMGLLFGMTAFEEHLFPQPEVTDDAGPPHHGREGQHRHPAG
ncbi:hypothetical protein [Streptomyces lancefieldiae]|uniref:Uncharacterized protein n=1 Tax=Streptomyces lancefieldiae TaxID=3075520 RepID=A0ABU3ANQ8_9ACTN|nr:hypothetical protein [Streptomyces sp. DSM 40712]MDT0611830.1 hypothetical protein [Streptomyces sp. DSM 40712]